MNHKDMKPKCQIHPRYIGVKRPKSTAVGCTCQEVYDFMNKKTPNFIGGQMMSVNDWGRAGARAARNLMKILPLEKKHNCPDCGSELSLDSGELKLVKHAS